MKKLLLNSLLALSAITASAGTMTLTTALETGTKVKILLNTKSATAPVGIDWGNGQEIKYTVDPSQMAYNRWIEGTVAGENITISGNITEATLEDLKLTAAEISGMSYLTDLNMSKNELVSFELKDIVPLERLTLSHNKLQNSVYENTTLSLENCAATLTNLNISDNSDIVCIDLRYMEVLEYVTANDCPRLGSVFICLPEESRKSYVSINLNNCDLAHFYPVSMPNLRVLDLANNELMSAGDDEPFALGDYPSLTSINIANNRGIKSLDITGCPKLESIDIANNGFTSLDVAQATELTYLNVSGNNISSLDLGNNKNLRTLNISGNPITSIDVDNFPGIQTLNISDTQISRVMLMNASYLKSFKASNTLLEFVDFNGQQASRMEVIDLRNCPNFTGETMDYTIHTLPEGKSSYSPDPTLLLSGSNAETADIGYATSIDMKWVCDIKGDGTAKHSDAAITLKNATPTGNKIAGHLDRLYPIFGMGLDYDLTEYSTAGGKFVIAQWQPLYFQSIKSVDGTALTGVPMCVYTYPEEGKKFQSITVNGKTISSPWFVVSGDSELAVNFTGLENSISFVTTPGTTISMLVNTVENNGTVEVDWGTGSRTPYTGQNSYTEGYAELKGSRIDGSAAGSTITIYGNVAGLDVSGYGDVAEWFGLWDNKITAIDLSQADNLKLLNAYFNPISTIDLSGAPNLEVLDLSYTLLKEIDLSHTPNLMWLEAYSDGYGDEEEGIAQLTSLDVTCLPILQYLNVKQNKLTTLDLSKNPYLRWLNVNGNDLTSIDLSKNTILETLDLARNKLTSLDITAQKSLYDLSVDGNELETLDLSKNTGLTTAMLSNNRFTALDLSAISNLRRLYINGNGMTAEQLNDVYYLLPERAPGDDDQGTQLSYNLAVVQGLDKAENDGTGADSSIALDRGWTPSHQGSNANCDNAYLDIIATPYGTVVLTDEQGNVYTHGSKVPKYSKINIEAVPNQGYTFASFTLNGEEPLTGTSFDMPGIYTKFRATFARGSGIDDASADNVKVFGGNSTITVAGETTVDIFSIDGKHIVSAAAVAGVETFEVPAGVYIVRAATGGTASKVVVK